MQQTGTRIRVLMITYNRPRYTRKALSSLLDSCGDDCRVWVWHNGNDEDTLQVVQSFQEHPRFERMHHSEVNLKLREPTNWFWENAEGDYLGKVDDDCIMPDGWVERLVEAHRASEQMGILSCWPFLKEDIREDLVAKKTVTLGGHRVFANPWVGGAGYVMKRACLERCGPLRKDEGFTSYCMRVARAGWTVGWLLPLLVMDHMDDPRSKHTVFKTDADVLKHRGLTAERRGIETVEQLASRVREAALELQTCSADWRSYIGYRARLRRAAGRLLP